ncbi:hypothetical protein P618_200032 [Holospora obtusa F1]|uniref:ABC transporter permease n=1 Tax=Holospora obtusa F1 TaxID=1399147 RepID=W6TFH1_HOLOB|nr:ABC transporter permease [Holospora obtusa]ETZ07761.1 hypothetical protein P618_200032 [Holospora obtusa F1]
MTCNELFMSFELGLIYGIAAIGIYLTFRVIDFPDLTCDGSFVLGSAVCSTFINNGYNPFVSLIFAMLAGSVAGTATGILCTKLKIQNLLSGILVGFMLYSVNLRVMGGIPNMSIMNHKTIFSDTPLLQLFIVSLISFGIVSYILMTDFGLSLISIGQNTRLAQNSGVNVSLISTICLALSNAFIALSGALFCQHQEFSDIGNGVGTVIVSLASVMIGEKIFPYRSTLIKVMSCLVGSIVYRLLISFALHSDILGISTSDLNLITGLIIIAMMAISRRKLC